MNNTKVKEAENKAASVSTKGIILIEELKKEFGVELANKLIKIIDSNFQEISIKGLRNKNE